MNIVGRVVGTGVIIGVMGASLLACSDTETKTPSWQTQATRSAVATKVSGGSSYKTPTAETGDPFAKAFGCRWILDTYASYEMLGRTSAITALASEMNAKVGYNYHIGPGDAASALRECE